MRRAEIALARQSGAADSAEIRPIRIAFKVPSTLANGNSWSEDTMELDITRFMALDSNGDVIWGRTIRRRSSRG